MKLRVCRKRLLRELDAARAERAGGGRGDRERFLRSRVLSVRDVGEYPHVIRTTTIEEVFCHDSTTTRHTATRRQHTLPRPATPPAGRRAGRPPRGGHAPRPTPASTQ